VNDYKYEAHKKIPQQILARTGDKTPLTVLDLGCGTPANTPVCMCPRCGAAAPTCELMYPRCGTGLLARPFFSQSEAHEVTGVDITPEMTAAAAALPYKRLITGRAQEVLSAELAGERFDVILLVGMLEFIEEPAAFVAMVAAFLEEGGLLGVGAPEKQPFALEK
jgi:SAM-dependent methyltransferase